MEKGNTFFKVYFILAIVYAILGLLDSLVFSGMKTVGQISPIWSIIVTLSQFAMFILSIIALVIFIKNKFAKITFVIPIYHLIFIVVINIFGIAWVVISALQGNPVNEISTPPGTVAIGTISSLFELLFSIYILIKFK